jgi:hypothetical protein
MKSALPVTIEEMEGPKTEVENVKEKVAAAKMKVARTEDKVARTQTKTASEEENNLETVLKHCDSPDIDTEMRQEFDKIKYESDVSSLKAAQKGLEAEAAEKSHLSGELSHRIHYDAPHLHHQVMLRDLYYYYLYDIDIDLLMRNLEEIRLGQLSILSRLPSVIIELDITPSIASTAEDSRYATLLDFLGVDHPVIPESDSPYRSEYSESKFEWNWCSHSKESDSYEPLCDYLMSLNLFPVDVSNGKYLFAGHLFDTTLWSIRKYNAAGERELIVYKGYVRGRTDIVLLNERHRGGDLSRHMLRFVIEVKDATTMHDNPTGCVRESVTQLLGLCGDNCNNTPSVLLTDLTKTFFVVYLSKTHEPAIKFQINIRACADLGSGVDFAQSVSEHRCSTDFGRPIPAHFVG